MFRRNAHEQDGRPQVRWWKKALEQHLDCLCSMDMDFPRVLEELVLELHENPEIMVDNIVEAKRVDAITYGMLRIMDHHTFVSPRIAGNAAFVLGALIDAFQTKQRVIELLRDEDHIEETQHCLPNLAAIINTGEPEPMTNASGTASLIFESEDSLKWALEQTSCEWLISILAQNLVKEDMWVASNCALTLARICMNKDGIEKILNHADLDDDIVYLILSVGVDDEGRGMNAAFALAYICDQEEGMKKVSELNEFWDLMHGLIQMLRSLDDGCKKNSVFCLKAMSQWEMGKERICDDPDVVYLLELLTKLLTAGDEDLAKLSASIIANLSTVQKGYMLIKDEEKVSTKNTLKHVLSQMAISEEYRAEAMKAMDSLMLDKPSKPVLKVLDSNTIEVEWEEVASKSGFDVHYELYCENDIAYTGTEASFVVRGLREKTSYEFRLKAFTADDEESYVSDAAIITTFRAVSSPPMNVRAIQVTSSQCKIVWEKPEKICGKLAGYHVREQGSSIHYEPVYMYYIASNLEADKEYTFEICAVTKRGRGEFAKVTVRTLGNDCYVPSKPMLKRIGSKQMAVSWDAPSNPTSRITGYEVMCNGKAIYFGKARKCIAAQLKENTLYKFSVVAWTGDGRKESVTASKKTGAGYKKQKKQPPSKKKVEKWLKDEEELPSDSDDESEEEITMGTSDAEEKGEEEGEEAATESQQEEENGEQSHREDQNEEQEDEEEEEDEYNEKTVENGIEQADEDGENEEEKKEENEKKNGSAKNKENEKKKNDDKKANDETKNEDNQQKDVEAGNKEGNEKEDERKEEVKQDDDDSSSSEESGLDSEDDSSGSEGSSYEESSDEDEIAEEIEDEDQQRKEEEQRAKEEEQRRKELEEKKLKEEEEKVKLEGEQKKQEDSAKQRKTADSTPGKKAGAKKKTPVKANQRAKKY